MKKTIYLFSNGEIHRKDNTVYFLNESNEKKYIPVEQINEILIFGEVTLNKKLLEFMTQKEIIIHYFSYYGYYMGSFYPREHYNSGYMILNQCKHYMDQAKRLDLANTFVRGSYQNILKVINYYKNKSNILPDTKEIESFESNINKVKSIENLMAFEGQIRETYYQFFDYIINNKDFAFETRTRRPPKNYLNALISFGNSLLYVTVLSEIYKTHLDPRIGFLHTTNFRRFTLNLDIAEIFKPILVDRLIFNLINKNEIQKKHFEKELNGIMLKESGRKIYVEKWDKRLKETINHPNLKRRISYRRLIRMECYKLEKHLIGDKIYKPYLHYW
ncbi:MAG: type I-B CRISPR-associated endonuclease Cas1b [Spirochaetota bacterium]|nr:type I-B CRISPR-associated endonuclease Cas1b [Spirochaetota bacterium]